jgi:hypothetical protein
MIMTISLSDIATLITAIVALVGLILSVYNFYVDRKDKSPRLVAKISNGFLTSGQEFSDVMVFLEIANHGEKAVKISAVEIVWKKRKLVFVAGIDGTNKIPFDLQSGDKATFWTSIKEVSRALKEQGCRGKESIKACFRTAVDSEFTSKAFIFNVNEWTKSE